MNEQALTLPAERSNPPSLSGTWLWMARITWALVAMAAVALLIAALPGYAARFGGQLLHVSGSTVPPGTRFFAAASGVASLTSVLLSLYLSVALFRRKFGEWMAALLSFFLLLYGVVLCGPLEYAATYWLGSATFASTLQSLLLATPFIALLLLFPNGRFVPRWTRWILLLSVPWNTVLLALSPVNADMLSNAPLLFYTVVTIFLALVLVGFYAQLYRYRRTATQLERQQIRWALYGFALWIGYILISSIPYYYLVGLPPGAPSPWWAPASELGWWLSLSILPVCLTIAITRYRLWDVNIVINRTLVYGALTAIVVGFYALVVGGMGLLFRSGDSFILPLLATGLAAVLFHPLRVRLQRAVNRLMYGERDEPFEVLARLGADLEKTLSPDMVYPTLVETIARTLKLPYAAIAVWQDGNLETVESYGKEVDGSVVFPLSYQGAPVGQLQVAPRTPTESFTAGDERLLRNLARQAGAAVHAVKLMADLQASRRQLVTAREEERRRLRRDLHDGLGPQLASQTLTLDAIDKLLARDPQRARELLQDLKTQSQRAVQDIRRLIHDLRPPALDELGLVGALEEEAARQSHDGLRVTVEAPSPLPPIPAAVEVALYRVAQEAVTNVVRHADASRCTVRLALPSKSATPSLLLVVQDDGRGLPPDYRAGVGLQSMRERVDELDGRWAVATATAGGTWVKAEIPLSVPHESAGGSARQ